ncbi:MAG: hypothetical protein ABH834_08700 [Candidatus Altiarchaeota archaeon]
MVSVRRISGKEFPDSGRRARMDLSQEEVIERIVEGTSRFGPRIRLNQLASVPSTGVEAALLAQVHADIQANQGSGSATLLQQLNAKAHVLQITSGFRRISEGRPPTVFQVLAVPAVRYGPDSDELDEMSRVMKSVETRHPQQATWEGRVGVLRSAIRRRIPGQIERELYGIPASSRDTREIMDALSLEGTTQERLYVGVSLQLLEVAGFVKKQLPHNVPGARGGELSVWSHRAYENPFPRHPNTHLNVLDALYNGGSPVKMQAPDLYRATPFPTATQSQPPYSIAPVLRALAELEAADLITTRQVRRGKQETTEAGLTGQGEEYLDEMHAQNALPEGLRKLILGEKH